MFCAINMRTIPANFSVLAFKLREEIEVTDRQKIDILTNSSPIEKIKLPLTPLALLRRDNEFFFSHFNKWFWKPHISFQK